MNGARRNLWVVMLPLWQKKTTTRFFSVSLLFASILSFPPASQSASPTTRSTFLEDDDDGLGNGPDDPQAVVSRFVPIYGLQLGAVAAQSSCCRRAAWPSTKAYSTSSNGSDVGKFTDACCQKRILDGSGKQV